MKILAFNGSLRPNGNTREMIEHCLKPMQKKGYYTEIIQVGGALLHGCMSCNSCTKTGYCTYRDDNINEWIKKMKEADAIIIASPVYYANMTAELKAFLERTTMPLFQTKALSKKIGAAIITARKGESVNINNAFTGYFAVHNMIVPMGSYSNIMKNTSFINKQDQGDELNREETKKSIDILSETIIYLLEKLNT